MANIGINKIRYFEFQPYLFSNIQALMGIHESAVLLGIREVPSLYTARIHDVLDSLPFSPNTPSHPDGRCSVFRLDGRPSLSADIPA